MILRAKEWIKMRCQQQLAIGNEEQRNSIEKLVSICLSVWHIRTMKSHYSEKIWFPAHRAPKGHENLWRCKKRRPNDSAFIFDYKKCWHFCVIRWQATRSQTRIRQFVLMQSKRLENVQWKWHWLARTTFPNTLHWYWPNALNSIANLWPNKCRFIEASLC